MIGDCLENLIGINNQCSTTAPTSGLFLQDLPLVSLDLANAATKKAQSDGVTMLQEVIDFSEQKLVQDFRTFLQPYARENSIVQNDTIGFYKDNLRAVASEAGQYKGIKVSIEEYPYMSLNINSFKLLLDAAVTTNLIVFDLLTGTQLSTHSVTTVADVPTEVFINQSYTTGKQRMHLFFAIDSSVAGTYETNMGSNQGCRGCGTQPINIATFTGEKLTQGVQEIDTNLSSINGSNGISLNYSLSCDVDPFLCNISNRLGWPMLHLAGAELMKRVMYNDRLNSYVTIHEADAQKLMEDFMNEYNSSMNDLLDNITIPTDICFDCNDRVVNKVLIP